ncbi:unnamed protein product [Caenorhabditis bovis]|uniref:Vitellogenin domain-containing protein n=1 Tax=Caenorhabditis bovis TaxID=2654633 RepID=A0A8S1EAF5_9PELO|nr:unnamed protein product [Caenorhabditis bovis]
MDVCLIACNVMRAIIIASLLALAFAATPAYEQNFTPKTEYHYKFDGLILSGLPTASSDMAQTRVSCRARIQMVDDLYVHLQLINIRFAGSHLPETEQMPSLNSLEQRELSAEHKEILELPVRSKLRNGLVSELHFADADEEWSKNLKRAVLNMISFHQGLPQDDSYENEVKQNSEKYFVINEKTLEGDCSVAYTIDQDNKKTVITKSIDFNKCIMRPESVYGYRFISECPECLKNSEILKPQTVYTYTLENGRLVETYVHSVYSLNVNGNEIMKTETRSKLTYEEEHKINNEIKKMIGEKEEIFYSTKWEEMLENFYKNGDKIENKPFEKFPTDRKIRAIRMITEHMQEYENNMPETAHQMARLVRVLRTTSLEELSQVHNIIYKKADQKIKNIIEHALSVAGTKNTIHHLIHHIEKEDITPIKAVQILKSIQETPFPSEQIADLLVELAKSQVARKNELIRQSAWLAAGSVVRGATSKTADVHFIREDTREIKEKFLTVFLNQYKIADSTYDKILALKTLGNAGIDLSINEIVKIALSRRVPLVVRREALESLRLLKDIMPRKIQKVLLPIYKNRQLEPELRMSALWRLMSTHPEESVLVQVASQMQKESNQQVATFTYYLLRQFAQSVNPCHKRLAADSSRVLSFVRYQPSEDILSIYSQLPLFHEQLLSGAQFDFTAIFGKNSFLPKELHTTLESVFGGNWNKYFAQIGFSQEYFDQVVVKIIDKLEKYNIKESTIVRGRRVQTGIKMLKDLAKKLNIRARLDSRQEKNGYAMAYLRYKDMDYVVLPVDNEMFDKLISKYLDDGRLDVQEIRRILNKESEFEAHHAAFFYETIRRIPSTIGFPIYFTGKIPTVTSIEGKFSVELREREALFTIEVRPSISATNIYQMNVLVPVFENGVKTLQSLRAFTPIKLETTVSLKNKLEIDYKVIVPENQKSVIAITNRPVVFLRFPAFSIIENVETEERTVPVPQWRQKTQELEKTYNFYGLEFTTRGNILRQWNLENFLLVEQDFEFIIENKKRPVEFSARLAIEMPQQADLSEIKFDNVFDNELELEDSETEKRRDYFDQMIRKIKNENGYKQRISLNLQAPRDLYWNTAVVTVCDKYVRVCKFQLDTQRSPVFDESKEWTLNSVLLAARPEMPSSLRQLREQPHREVQFLLKTKWGSNLKNEVTVKAQLQQSKEQKNYLRNAERQYNGIPEYELLIKAARLNQVKAVAEYKLSRDAERTFTRLFDILKAYNFWTVSELPKENEDNRIFVQLTVEPYTRQYVNLTVQSPEQTVELRNMRVPRLSLPSIAQHSLRYQLNKKISSTCKVQEKEVMTFDRLTYRAPLTTCYSVIAKDCSEEPRFAVLAKKLNKNTKKLALQIIRNEQEILLELRNEEMLVKIDNMKIPTTELEQFDIEVHGNKLVVVQLPEGEVHFDGFTVKTHLPAVSRKNLICGLCGNNDDETTNEFRTAEDIETEDIEEFHRSYLLKNDQCEIEEDRLSEKKNYKKYEDSEDESYDDEDYENYRSDRPLREKTYVKEFSHRVCFSLEPVVECDRQYEAKQTLVKKIRFTCMPRHEIETRRYMKEARTQILSLDDFPVSYIEAIEMPTACVAY